jgi:two-component system, OmpR family, sensor histidine kinase CiaH
MFQSARFKLTAWYLAIIMLISISFSIFVYRQIMFEVRRSLRAHAIQVLPEITFSLPFSPSVTSFELDVNQIYEEIRQKILLQLIGVNAGIFALSGLAGYMLAGKTLHPIEAMVDDQKRFVSDASHELRTPLTAMKTEIEVAIRDKRLSLADARSLLKSNLEEVNHMQTLANYLLTLGKYQSDNHIFPQEHMAVPSAVEKAVTRQKHQAKQKRITIETHFEEVSIYGNPVSITELATILLDNAIKYSNPQSRVVLRTKKVGTSVLLEVEDFGIGIHKNELPYIFHRFYRADSSRNKATNDGYGLGLSIAEKIVEMHGGKIDVKSKLNAGTTFIVSFPLSRHAA